MDGGLLPAWGVFARPLLACVCILAMAACGGPVVSRSDPGPTPGCAQEGTSLYAPEPPFPGVPVDSTLGEGVEVDAECRANRELRADLPVPSGARLVGVSDIYVIEGGGEADPTGRRRRAVGVQTTWSYEWDGASKCQVAATLEEPLAANGWLVFALETSADRATGSTFRSADLQRGPAAVHVGWGPPNRVTLSVQAHSTRRLQLQENGQPFPNPFTPCRPDVAPPPPFPAELSPGGTGHGPSGSCDGTESDPPCGPGAELGRSYAYTVIQRCNGVIWFDGREWEAGLMPPNEQAPLHVWIRLDAPSIARWEGAPGSIGYVPKGEPGRRDTPRC